MVVAHRKHMSAQIQLWPSILYIVMAVCGCGTPKTHVCPDIVMAMYIIYSYGRLWLWHTENTCLRRYSYGRVHYIKVWPGIVWPLAGTQPMQQGPRPCPLGAMCGQARWSARVSNWQTSTRRVDPKGPHVCGPT